MKKWAGMVLPAGCFLLLLLMAQMNHFAIIKVEKLGTLNFLKQHILPHKYFLKYFRFGLSFLICDLICLKYRYISNMKVIITQADKRS